MDRNETCIARNAFLNILMDQAEWGKILTDQQITDWHQEARQIFTQLPQRQNLALGRVHN